MIDLNISNQPISFFTADNALLSVIIINAYKWTPFTAIVFLAGLQTIPNEVIEAAMVDGANALRRFIHISLSYLKPIFITWSLITFVRTFNGFDIVYLTTGGGPGDATRILGIYLYDTTFKIGDYGSGAALSVLMTLISILFILLYLKFVGE